MHTIWRVIHRPFHEISLIYSWFKLCHKGTATVIHTMIYKMLTPAFSSAFSSRGNWLLGILNWSCFINDTCIGLSRFIVSYLYSFLYPFGSICKKQVNECFWGLGNSFLLFYYSIICFKSNLLDMLVSSFLFSLSSQFEIKSPTTIFSLLASHISNTFSLS